MVGQPRPHPVAHRIGGESGLFGRAHDPHGDALEGVLVVNTSGMDLIDAGHALENLGDGTVLAANSYTLLFSPTDHQHIAAEYELNRKTFSKHLENFIKDNGWQTYGKVVVEFEQSPSLHTGIFRARGTVNPDARPRPVAAARRPPTTEESSPRRRSRAAVFGSDPRIRR